MSDTYRSKLRSASKAKLEEEEEDRMKQSQQEASSNEEPEQDHDPPLLPSPQTPPMTDMGDPATEEYTDLEAFFPPSPYGRKRNQIYGDRFIPSRDDNLVHNYHMMEPPSSRSRNPYLDPDFHSGRQSHNRRIGAIIQAEVMGDSSVANDFTQSESSSSSSSRTPRRILNYTSRQSPQTPPRAVDSPTSPRFQTGPFSEAGRRVLSTPYRIPRDISRTAIKILDAPELQDDFYLNLIDWGPNDSLAVGLGSCVYLWNANTSRVTKLCDFINDPVTSVSWASHGPHLAIGTNKGTVYLWDTEASRRIRTWSGHVSRTGALAWCNNILTSGSRDHNILHRDVRSSRPYFRELNRHIQEVCGLKWSPDGSMLASGGNDNNLMIWESHQNKVLWTFSDHTAAVKAIGWNPHSRGVLVSGGGTADKTIRFWNAISGTSISSYDTGSQVCNVAWSKRTNEIVSTHGYASNSDSSSNQVIIWKANNMQRIATLSGHTSRVLYMSMSYDGSTVVTGAGDETLRFWDVFSSVKAIRRQPEDRRSCLR